MRRPGSDTPESVLVVAIAAVAPWLVALGAGALLVDALAVVLIALAVLVSRDHHPPDDH